MSKIPNLQLLIELEVKDKDGKTTKTYKAVSKSFVKNFALALRALMYGTCYSGIETLKDTSGNLRTYPRLNTVSDPVLCVNAPSGNDSFGIQIGSGTNAVTRDDYKLQTKINHGTGSGQISYGAMSVETVDGTPPTSLFRLIRTFSNNTSSAVTVNEIGLVFQYRDISIGFLYFLIARDVLAESITINPEATLTVRYIVSITA